MQASAAINTWEEEGLTVVEGLGADLVVADCRRHFSACIVTADIGSMQCSNLCGKRAVSLRQH